MDTNPGATPIGPVFLDGHSTTPVDPRVVEAMAPYWSAHFANPASSHWAGERARDAVEAARAAIARAVGADPQEIAFTSGATESNNLALLGVARALRQPGGRIVSIATEHSAVLDPLAQLAREGFEVQLLPVDRLGRVDAAAFAEAVAAPGVVLASAMHANNETGLVADLAPMAAACRAAGVPFHTDAAQSLGKIPVDVRALGADLASFSAHKLHGPKGIGALYARRGRPRVRLAPQMHGGGHEGGLRSGTLNVPAIVGFAKAVEIAVEGMPEESARLARLRDLLADLLLAALPGAEQNGDPSSRLPNSLNLWIPGVEAQALLNGLPDVAVSTGSACSSADPEPSHVLRAMFGGDERARSSVRFGVLRTTTGDEVRFAAARVAARALELRALAGG